MTTKTQNTKSDAEQWAFRYGYLEGCVRTALRFLERGEIAEAKALLESAAADAERESRDA